MRLADTLPGSLPGTSKPPRVEAAKRKNCRNAVFLLAGVACATTVARAEPTPAPTASPLKVIIEVHSRALCTALTSRIGPAIAGIIKNDQIIDQGHKGMLVVFSSPRQGRQQADYDLKYVVSALVHNIKALDDVLNAPLVFKETPTTDDARRAAALKAQVQAIEDKQKAALNAISGLVDTEAMGDARYEGIWGAPNSQDELGSMYKDTSLAPAGAGAAAANVTHDPNQRDVAGGPGDLMRQVEQAQTEIAALEAIAAPDITQVATECGATAKPSSTPQPR